VPLTPGTRFGIYEIGAQAGKGGMGEVYVARDSKLGRDVAIKVLPESMAMEPARLARFEREARLLAALNHPHIAQIYGLEHADGVPALVMELVDGPTLADRIATNRPSLLEAAGIARQIATALEAAHEQGIVHRDLKPANIKLTSRGEVKVLDFGLATVREQPSAAADLPTQEVSSANAIVGTPAYMSPEQAKGEPATHAADVWAFGCVLFALLCGRPPFDGASSTEVLAGILKSEPDWSRLPAETPPAIRRLLRRCLAKDVRARFHHIADVRLALDDVEDAQAATPVRGTAWKERAAWIAATVGLAAAMIVFAQRPDAPPERRFDIVTPPEADAGGIALPADGTRIAYTALAKGVPYLYVRSLENGSVRTLAGTEGAALPFWSPAGDALAFFAQSRLKRVDLLTGAVQSLAQATLSPGGGSWNADGIIVFAPSIRGRILRVPAEGGEVTQVLAEGRSPRFLSDGRRFLFLGLPGISVGSLDSPGVTPVSDKVAGLALPGPPGYLTFMKTGGGGRVFVQAFDEQALTLTGAETVIAERVQSATDGVSASAAVSQTGIIAVRDVSDTDVQARRIGEFDRAGVEIRRFERGGLSPSASPNFDYVAVSRATEGNAVYLLELARGVLAPFTSGPADQTALWSPDGRHIVFATARRKRVEMFIKPVDGGEEQPLLDPPPDLNSRVATDWVGDLLLFRANSPDTNYDVYALPMAGADRRPIPVVRTEASERDAQFSPDTKWVAYETDKSGRSEIYLTRFPGRGREFRISPDGGAQVRWNPANRNELFYVSLDGRLMSIRLEFTSDDAAVEAPGPVPLFQTQIGTVVQGAQKQQYVVSRDGQRFLVSNVIEEALSPIRLILNWKPRSN
jgi:Tol biopolymer transport system component/predicted Ser/Thr protein kinase